jgi:hypothetical protein
LGVQKKKKKRKKQTKIGGG